MILECRQPAASPGAAKWPAAMITANLIMQNDNNMHLNSNKREVNSHLIHDNYVLFKGSISLSRHPAQNCSSVYAVIWGMWHTAPLPRPHMLNTPLHNTAEDFLLTDKSVENVKICLFFFFKICCSLVHYRQYSHPSTKQLQYNCISLDFSLLCLCFEKQCCAVKS